MKRPPEGVSLEYADGTVYEELPLEDLGPDENGIQTWRVMLPRDDEAPVSAFVRYWPAKTALVLPMLQGMEDES